MYNKLKKLIEKHYYADRETAISKVDTVFLMNKITQEQYTDLMLLIDEHYPAPNAVEEVEEAEEE